MNTAATELEWARRSVLAMLTRIDECIALWRELGAA